MYVETIIRTSERMACLIDSFLDVSLIDAGRFPLELAPLDVPHLIGAACQAVEPAVLKRSLQLRIDIAEDLPPTPGDESKLEQVLINLLSNGIEHSSEGGVMTVGCRKEGSELLFLVTDHGQGMDAEQKGRLFSAFSGSLAQKSDGTRSIGLGLMIAHKIVTAHGGHMVVESEPGTGSTFGFTIPVSTSAAAEQVEPL